MEMRVAIVLAAAVLAIPAMASPSGWAARGIIFNRVHERIVGATAVDGDTFDYRGSRYRMYGIDAPEDRSKCKAEKDKGLAAKRELAVYLSGFRGPVVLYRGSRHDKYGRKLAQVQAGGKDV